MFSYRRLVVLLMGVLVAGGVSMAFADEAGDAGRAILEKNKSAIVTIKLVVKQQVAMMGNSDERESKTEITGTVIDATGLTVVSLSATDPSSLMQDMMGSRMEGFRMETRVTDAKILTDDGKEIPVKIVLRDKDLDLAFIRPLEPAAQPFQFLDLNDAATPQILDEMIAINRLGKVASRSYAASVERVESVVTKPRTLYMPAQNQSSATVGCPAFALDGKVIGVAVLRSVKTGDDWGMGMLSGGNAPKVVILPAKEIMQAAAQAPQANEVADEPPLPEQPAPDKAAGDETTTEQAPSEEGANENAPAPQAPAAGAAEGKPQGS